MKHLILISLLTTSLLAGCATRPVAQTYPHKDGSKCPEDNWLPEDYIPKPVARKAAWCCEPMAFFDHAEDCPSFPYGPEHIVR